ncbi:hypothetical protein EYC80_004110 [Monilinia laxa]|uniref:Uncharacterized protein n=1 Tax=Monilinia laxa TaxID=61186 RepID=A0A5N6KM34_MONLA|nr:hypothetical protein EYC80_004110 [Monilinia laxa]
MDDVTIRFQGERYAIEHKKMHLMFQHHGLDCNGTLGKKHRKLSRFDSLTHQSLSYAPLISCKEPRGRILSFLSLDFYSHQKFNIFKGLQTIIILLT